MKSFTNFSIIVVLTLVLVFTLSPASGSGEHTGGHAETNSGKSAVQSTESISETADHHDESSGNELHQSEPSPGETDGHDRRAEANNEPAGGFASRLMPGFTGAPNIHPIFVHFPIALFITSLLFVLCSWFWNPYEFLRIARWLFWLGLIALPVTALTGFIAVGGWGSGHVVPHRNFMLLTTALAFLLFGVLRFVSDREWLYRLVMTVGLIVVVGCMTLGADRGAWLVFVEGSGVKPVQNLHNH